MIGGNIRYAEAEELQIVGLHQKHNIIRLIKD